MADKRLKSLERMLAIQSRMRSLAEWRQQAIQRQAAAARDESHALVAALNGDGLINSLFTDVTARRLHRVSVEIAGLNEQAAVQAREVARETGREKRAAKLADQARRGQHRTDQDKALLDIMESQEGKRAASLE
ncbi:hypothetical protein DWF00_10745 [Bosea caraganae]|uniref:Flagellar FliJ protein n=1 Tax=Bosea caraganae TaxID=2763117 RepID=A0A370LBT4_9HYPH|nr:hypothetical protein [Bosea caraganae]RDJ27427.1 hypothetical protein DWF00_10745 [Bosea caraganae]RDJ29443.1 hypothetical protein DWE98_02515 [Bosea caraganae]